MKTLGPSGEKLIKSFETLKLESYWDKLGKVWTIGWGHTSGVYENMSVTESQAQLFFLNDTRLAVNAVNSLVKVDINQNQFDALVSFAFNTGIGALQHSTLLQDLNSGYIQRAAQQFLQWIMSGSPLQVSIGLVHRRVAEVELFLS